MSGDGVVRNLLVVFGVEVKNLLAAERLQDGINAIEQGLGRLTSMAQKATIGLTALAGAVVLGTKPIADMAENTSKYAAAFGISTTRMQELQIGFEALGAKGDDLSDVFMQISEKARQATGGSKEATKAFKDLGINVSELAGMNPDQLFDKLIVSFQNVGDAQTKFGLISQVMGEDLGKKLLPIMTKGGVSLETYAKIARDAGAIMDESQVKMGLKVANTYRRLMTVIQALKMRVGLELMPYVDRIGTKMWDWYQANKALISTKIHEYVKKIGNAMEWVKNTALQLGRLIEGMGGLEKVMKQVAAVFAIITGMKIAGIFVSIASGVFTVLSALTTGAAGWILPVIALVATWGAAIGLILEDFAVFNREGESLFGMFDENYDKLPMGFKALYLVMRVINQTMGIMSDSLKILSDLFGKAFEPLLPLLPYIIAAFVALGALIIAGLIAPLVVFIGITLGIIRGIELLGDALGTLAGFVVVGVTNIIESIPQIVNAAFDAVLSVFDSAKDTYENTLDGMFSFFGTWVDRILDLITNAPMTIVEVLSDMSSLFSTWVDEVIRSIISIPMTVFEVIKIPFNLLKALLGEVGTLIGGVLKGAGALMTTSIPFVGVLAEEMGGLTSGSIAKGQGQATLPWNTPTVRESRKSGGGGAGARNVNVTQGDTTIQVNGTGDPAAVASKVQKAQKTNMDRLFNGAANTAGGL